MMCNKLNKLAYLEIQILKFPYHADGSTLTSAQIRHAPKQYYVSRRLKFTRAVCRKNALPVHVADVSTIHMPQRIA